MKDMQQLSGVNEGSSAGDVVDDHKGVSPGENIAEICYYDCERYSTVHPACQGDCKVDRDECRHLDRQNQRQGSRPVQTRLQQWKTAKNLTGLTHYI
ncbi:hypothetical protein E2C01_009524 [Portunus trituberculatus]|uniref:Uncharacterized protein n=1 Tax=Portunus trituberculatus TaxID=210409 RepID=A0A5B7D610_PORTR|nr:hypothetical protein [Portunus trituberculatus]